MTNVQRFLLPQDANNDPVDRAMGFPIVATGDVIGQPSKTFALGRSDNYYLMYDLTTALLRDRQFVGIHLFNRAAAIDLHVVATDNLVSTPAKPDIIVPALTFHTFDKMTFGTGAYDLTKKVGVKYLLARLSGASGSFSTATIDYSGSGQPADGETVVVGTKTFEFSTDLHPTPGNIEVQIGATADDSWNNFATVVTANVQEVRVSNNPGADLVTVEANYPGLMGSDIVVADGSTGAVFSGNTGSVVVGAGGVEPIIHIW